MFPASEWTDGAIINMTSNGTNHASHKLCQDTAKMRGYGGYYMPFIHTRGFTENKHIPIISSMVHF